jgi:hypothetical protein
MAHPSYIHSDDDPKQRKKQFWNFVFKLGRLDSILFNLIKPSEAADVPTHAQSVYT